MKGLSRLRNVNRCYWLRFVSNGSKSDGNSNTLPCENSVSVPKASKFSAAASNQEINLKTKSSQCKVPLDVPYPGIENIQFSKPAKVTYDTEITTLEDGMRVGSQLRSGSFCTIGVAIESGARYENGFPRGISHIQEKLAFLSSKAFPTRQAIMKELESHGGVCDSQASRDTMIFAISAESKGLRPMMKLLSDIVLNPLYTEEEIRCAKTSVMYEIEDAEMRPDKEGMILEMIHEAAWNGNTLGRPRYCSSESLEEVNRFELFRFMKRNFTPGRIVVSGVGVDHHELVGLTAEYFDVSKAVWNSQESVKSMEKDEKAVYSGGENCLNRDFGPFNAGPLPVPKLAHMALGLESVSHNDRLFIPACVLNVMMGGGGSFSAGGPGKGMYSRLYTNVLNNKHWVYNTTAYNNSYSDSGLFYIYASAPPEYMDKMTDVLIKEIYGIAEIFDEDEFLRAKVQLQSMLLMNLESRPVVFEDIGRQLLAQGHYRPPHEYLELIDNVTKEDILTLGHKMLSSRASLAAIGNLHRLPKYHDITCDKGLLKRASSRRGLFL